MFWLPILPSTCVANSFSITSLITDLGDETGGGTLHVCVSAGAIGISQFHFALVGNPLTTGGAEQCSVVAAYRPAGLFGDDEIRWSTRLSLAYRGALDRA